MKRASPFFAALFFSTISASAWAEVKVGNEIDVPDWHWVAVKDREVSNGNGSFPVGDTCGIQAGGSVVVKGIHDGIADLVYHYGRETFGTPCPDGTHFSMQVSAFDQWDSARAQQNRFHADVNRILDGGGRDTVKGLSPGKLVTIPQWTWVTLARPNHNGNGESDAGDTCGINAYEKAKVIGFTPDHKQVMMHYEIDHQTYGSPCGAGAVFMADVDAVAGWDGKAVGNRQADANFAADKRKIRMGGGKCSVGDAGNLVAGMVYKKKIWIGSAGENAESECIAADENTWEVLGFDRTGKKVLVKTHAATNQYRGTVCGDGVVAWADVSDAKNAPLAHEQGTSTTGLLRKLARTISGSCQKASAAAPAAEENSDHNPPTGTPVPAQ